MNRVIGYRSNKNYRDATREEFDESVGQSCHRDGAEIIYAKDIDEPVFVTGNQWKGGE